MGCSAALCAGSALPWPPFPSCVPCPSGVLAAIWCSPKGLRLALDHRAPCRRSGIFSAVPYRGLVRETALSRRGFELLLLIWDRRKRLFARLALQRSGTQSPQRRRRVHMSAMRTGPRRHRSKVLITGSRHKSALHSVRRDRCETRGNARPRRRNPRAAHPVSPGSVRAHSSRLGSMPSGSGLVRLRGFR